jgi:hypothetical protein
LLATAMRAKFALALPSGSKPEVTVRLPLTDVRVQQRRTSAQEDSPQ